MKPKLLKKLSLFIVISLTFALISPFVQAAFTDVFPYHRNADAIEYVQSEGIVSGYEDGTYKPDRTINRAEFTKIVIEAQFDQTEIDGCKRVYFPDVPAGQWFTKYVCIARKNGIIQGYPDGTFKPAQNISFVEAAKVIVMTFGYEFGADPIWYKPFVEALGNKKAIPTTIDRFEKPITRGEMAEMIYRLKKQITTKTTKTYAVLSRPEAEPTIPLKSTREITITDGVKHSIPLESIFSGGPPKDGIPSIDEPQFVSIEEADQWIKQDGLGISLSIQGIARFYPNQITVWHEIVNDVIGSQPVLVTYCPLCGTGIVFDPTVKGESSEFGTTGKLWNSNLLMYDRKTDSVWSQALGEAVVGELTGYKLRLLPYDNVIYSEWKKEHPDGQVLSRDTGAIRDYTRDPYGNYYTNERLFFPVDNEDDRYHPKEPTFGIELNGKTKVYPESELLKGPDQFTDTFAGVDLKISFDKTLKTIDIRRVDTNEEIVPFYGFWFSWISVHPESEVYTFDQ